LELPDQDRLVLFAVGREERPVLNRLLPWIASELAKMQVWLCVIQSKTKISVLLSLKKLQLMW
jgi:hypothetical protein